MRIVLSPSIVHLSDNLTIDGGEVYRVENTEPRMFQDVMVFASDNFHPAADVRYKNLV